MKHTPFTVDRQILDQQTATQTGRESHFDCLLFVRARAVLRCQILRPPYHISPRAC